MKYLKLYDEYYKDSRFLNERLGIEPKIEDYARVIFEDIVRNNKINKDFISYMIDVEIAFAKKSQSDILSYDYIMVYYEKSDKFEAHLSEDKETKTLILTINPDYATTENLFNLLIHEINHIYNRNKGLKTEFDYILSSNIKNYLDVNEHPQTLYLVDCISNCAKTEIYSHVSELYSKIKQLEIKNKFEFNQFLAKNSFWRYTINLGNINVKELWQDIIKEQTDGLLVGVYDIKDVDKWLDKIKKVFEETSKEYKKRIGRLIDLL